MIAGQAERALSAQSRALALIGSELELLLDRAITLASAGEYWKAVDDLNDAIDQDPRHAGALVLRATAWRKLENLDLARDDIERRCFRRAIPMRCSSGEHPFAAGDAKARRPLKLSSPPNPDRGGRGRGEPGDLKRSDWYSGAHGLLRWMPSMRWISQSRRPLLGLWPEMICD